MAVINFNAANIQPMEEWDDEELVEVEIPDNVIPIVPPVFDSKAAGDALMANRRKEQQQRFQQIGEGTVIEQKDARAETLTKAEMLEHLVAVSGQKSCVALLHKPTFFRPREVMRTHFAHCETEVKASDGAPKMFKTFDLWANDGNRITVEDIAFNPNYGDFCPNHEGHIALNLWRYKPNNPPPNWKELIAPFLAHIEYLIPIESERDQFLDWLAHGEQKPGELPHFHYLMIAEAQGIGRNWIAGVLANMWAGNVAINFDLARTLKDGFNEALSKKILVVVDEINEGGKATRWDHSETLKSMVTASHRTINVKFGMKYSEVNCARWLLFSNHLTALPLDNDDRRWNVIRNPIEPKPPEYYSTLYALLKDQLFISSVRQFLIKRNIANFNPGSRAVKNEIKTALISSGDSVEDENAKQLVKAHPRDLISSNSLFFEIYEEAPNLANDANRKWRLLGSIARKAGMTKLTQEIPMQRGKPMKIWCLRNLDKWISVFDMKMLWNEIHGTKD